jgi:hypothetical protein
MDMKNILRALDSASKPAEGSNDMKKFLQIMEGTASLNQPAVSESIETTPTSITAPVLNIDNNAKPSMIGKYFKAVEQELEESEIRNKDRALQLAERVSNKLNGFYGNKPLSSKNLARAKTPPAEVVQSAKTTARKALQKEESNPEDVVSLNIPLLMRVMEYAKEDAKTDMDLHHVVEKMIELSQQGESLSMDNYDAIVGDQKQIGYDESVKEDKDPCWKNYKMVGTKKKGGKSVPNCVPK